MTILTLRMLLTKTVEGLLNIEWNFIFLMQLFVEHFLCMQDCSAITNTPMSKLLHIAFSSQNK